MFEDCKFIQIRKEIDLHHKILRRNYQLIVKKKNSLNTQER